MFETAGPPRFQLQEWHSRHSQIPGPSSLPSGSGPGAGGRAAGKPLPVRVPGIPAAAAPPRPGRHGPDAGRAGLLRVPRLPAAALPPARLLRARRPR